jgi:alkylation response protein AidB-like acyl-CoA dehydrogenase
MNFDLSEDQYEIKRTARDLLASRATWDDVRRAAEGAGEDTALWGELCELGWPGIAVAEEHGGSGLGVVELAVIAEELGFACAPVPFLGTALAATVVEHAGSAAQQEQWLGGLAAGTQTGAVAVIAQGREAVVPGATPEALVVVAEPGGGATLHAPGTAVAPADAIDPTRAHGRVAAGAPGGEPLEGELATALDRAAVVVAAELVGVCQRALDMTVAYVKDRKQFGVPVGSFQAVQHAAALMLRDTEGARAAVYHAAWAADAQPETLPGAAAMAKAAASDAGRSVTAAAIQLHGGIGFTWEADVHWLFKRAQLDSVLLGGAASHRARIVELLRGRQPVGAV